MKYVIPFLSIIFFTTACSKITPAGFWTGFHKNLITISENDQGPWGGHRKIVWNSGVSFFNVEEIIDYAKKNDWQLTDSIMFSTDTLTKESRIKYKNDDYSLTIFREMVLSELHPNDNRAFVFMTTWLAVEPGNTRETFVNGFVVLNSDGTEMKMYHLWGE